MPGRVYLDFDDNWRFHLGDAANTMGPALDDSAWRTLNVPHDWSAEGPFKAELGSGNGFAPGGIGWYRKKFAIDATARGKRVVVEFDGVYDHAEIWLNGQWVGGRPYGYSSFECDLTPYLDFEKENILAVRVDHSRYADSRWYTGSGIYRHVRLRITHPVHVGQWGTFVTTPDVAESSARAHVETTLVNELREPRAYSLQSEILTADGRIVAEQTSAGHLSPGENAPTAQNLDVPAPQLWSPESPTLYTLRSRVTVEGVVVDETLTPFGIRTFRFDPDRGFFLNGRSLKLKGVCIHHDAGSLGAAVPVKVLERRLRKLQELGVNAIRTSHNPPAPELLALCDRLGLLVKDEAFDEFTPPKKKWVQGWNLGEPSKFGYGEIFEEWSIRDIQDMVRRDRNHPCIILWSIGNEIDYPNDPFSHPVLGTPFKPLNPSAENLVKHGKPLIAAIKQLDTTRPVTAALAAVAMSDAVGFGELLDVVGYNYQEARYSEDHHKYPQRVIFGSENNHRYENWAVVRDNDYVCGQFLWTGIDYLGEAHAWPNRGNGAGLLDLCGFKKPEAWFRESLWSDKPMVYLCTTLIPAGSPSQTIPNRPRERAQERWIAPEAPNTVVTVQCYTNCSEVSLTLNGRLVGTKSLNDAVEGKLTWEVPYEPGIVKAVGLRQGKAVAEFALQSAGEPSRVELVPDTKTLRADGKDVCHVECRIVDAAGVRVPNATSEISVEIQGPAKVIGLGNGDLANAIVSSTHSQVYQGRGLIVLQSERAAGEVTVRVSSPGLSAASAVLSAQ